MLPSPDHSGLGLRGNSYRGHLWVHFRCGPVTRSPSQGRLCRLASSASFPPRMQPKLRGSDSFPGGTHLPLNMPAFAGRTMVKLSECGFVSSGCACCGESLMETDRWTLSDVTRETD